MGLLDDLIGAASTGGRIASDLATEGVRAWDDFAKARTEARETEEKWNDIDERLQKAAVEAWKKIDGDEHEPEDPKGLVYDPFDMVSAMGYRERPSSFTYQAMDMVGRGVPVVADVIKVRATQVQMFCGRPEDRHSPGLRIRLRDWQNQEMTEAARKEAALLEEILLNTGYMHDDRPHHSRKTLKQFAGLAISDSLIFDQVNFEIVPDRKGEPSYLRLLDPSTIRLLDPGEYNGKDEPFAVQVIDGSTVADFTREELAFCTRNGRTGLKSYGYGLSELETLVREVTGFLWGMDYNRKFFVQGSAQKGILNFKGAIPDRQLRAFRRQWYTMLSGVSNCIGGSTVIWTREHGATSVETVLADGAPERPVTVWTGTDWRDALVYRTPEPKALQRTVLDNGAAVETSPEHRFKVLGEDGLPTWRRQEDLEIGDYVLVNRQPVVGDADAVPEFQGQRLTGEMAEVLGWMVGDGYLVHEGRGGHGKRNQLHLYYHHEREHALRDRHCEVLQAFGANAIPHDRVVSEEEAEKLKEKFGFRSIAPVRRFIRVCQVDFTEWLIGLGFQTAKVIPAMVHVWPEALRSAFLRGFFSADGNLAKKRYPQITIANDELREQTRMLLVGLGIRTVRHQGKSRLVIDGRERTYRAGPSYLVVKDREPFFEKVGFLQAHKQPKKLLKPNEANKHSRVPRQTYRRFLLEVRQANNVAGKTLLTKQQRMDLNSILTDQDGCSLGRLTRYMETTGVEVPGWLRNYWFVPVVDLEATGEVVSMFDLSLDDERHQFMANGALTHNSWKTPITNAEELQWINMQLSNRDMEYSAWMDFLIKIICARYQIAPEEVNFSYGNTGQSQAMGTAPIEEKLKASQDLGLRPLVWWFFEQLNAHLVQKINPDFEAVPANLDAQGFDAETDLLTKQQHIFLTVDESRERMELEPIGEERGGHLILDPTYAIYLQQKEAQALQEEQAEQAAEQQAQAGGAPAQPGQVQFGPPDQQAPAAGQQPDPGDFGVGMAQAQGAGLDKSEVSALDSEGSPERVRYIAPLQ